MCIIAIKIVLPIFQDFLHEIYTQLFKTTSVMVEKLRKFYVNDAMHNFHYRFL